MIKALPHNPDNFYDLDDIYSHAYNIIGGEAILDLNVVEKMLNKYILNFKGAPLRKLSFSTFLDEYNERKISIKGEMRLAMPWLSFTMIATMTLDELNGRIVLTAEEINTMGIVPADRFMNFLGISLKNLITLPKDLAIYIEENSIIIIPLLLFPPPQLTGRVSAIELKEKHIDISFEQLEQVDVPPRTIPTAVNDLFLFGGDIKIAQSRYINMSIHIFDRDPKGIFEFHVPNYFKHISTSIIGFPAVNALTISTLSYPRL